MSGSFWRGFLWAVSLAVPAWYLLFKLIVWLVSLKEVGVKILFALLVSAVVFAPLASADVGEDAGNTPKRGERGAVARSQAAAAYQPGERPRLFQNRLVWVGQPNPEPPPITVINTFQPLAVVPPKLRGAFGWLGDFQFEACALGLSQVTYGQNIVGPYGTSTTGFSRSGCK